MKQSRNKAYARWRCIRGIASNRIGSVCERSVCYITGLKREWIGFNWIGVSRNAAGDGTTGPGTGGGIEDMRRKTELPANGATCGEMRCRERMRLEGQ